MVQAARRHCPRKRGRQPWPTSTTTPHPRLAGSTPGPWVSIAVPRRAYVSWLLHNGGDLVEVYIGGERTGGLYLTLHVHHLDRLIGQLRAAHATVDESSAHTPAPPETSQS
jgi:hypothetical protein